MHPMLRKTTAAAIEPEDDIMLRAKVVTAGKPLHLQSDILRHAAQRMMQESKRLKRIEKEK